jgi:sigma-B regulation protein RsbU (phosphoserine phosphatase)
VLFTDGVTEAMDPDGEMYEEPRFEAFLARPGHTGPENLVKGAMADVLAFTRGADPSDDITLLALSHLA